MPNENNTIDDIPIRILLTLDPSSRANPNRIIIPAKVNVKVR
jgi:hypothetical protein